MKRLLVFEPTYTARIWVIAPGKWRDAARLMKTIAPKHKEEPDDDFHGCTWSFNPKEHGAKNDNTFLVVLKKWRRGNLNDTATLVHEVVHVVHGILDNCGMKLSDETEEAYAYLTDSLFYRIVAGLK